MSEKEKIEFETVSIKLPKLIMEYLRKTDNDPVGWIEFNVVDNIRAKIEAMDHTHWIKRFGLGRVFYAILEDDRYI